MVRWYLRSYFRTPNDPGTLPLFASGALAGPFAIDVESFERGDPDTLFRLLVSTVMFQRRRDVVIFQLQRSLAAAAARELTTQATLLRLAENSCRWSRGTDVLHDTCDLAKAPGSSLADCGRYPGKRCHLKRHTLLLKRYGDFGKYPTSAALVIRDAGGGDLAQLRAQVFAERETQADRSARLEELLVRIHRVSRKLANMFLALVSNPDLSPGAPWQEGLDWTRFVVIDSNVDAFLGRIGYDGASSYEARSSFVRSLADRIDLSEFDGRLHPFNPRVVQQAMYVFMGRSNRTASGSDCSGAGPAFCRRCPGSLRKVCPVRSA